MTPWILACVILLLLSVTQTLIAIKKRKMAFIYSALAIFLLFLGVAGWTVFKFVTSSYRKLKASTEIKQRSGLEIYTAVFNSTPANCLKITNYKDHVMPILDCCIWLELSTCPHEMERVLTQSVYEAEKLDNTQLSLYMPGLSSEMPSWWNPRLLGDTVLAFTYKEPNKDRIQRFFVSRDSTKAFYYDAVY
jgi:hypothetical protein